MTVQHTDILLVSTDQSKVSMSAPFTMQEVEMKLFKLVFIVVGAFHMTSCVLGSVNLIDYHVCIMSPGMCGEH